MKKGRAEALPYTEATEAILFHRRLLRPASCPLRRENCHFVCRSQSAAYPGILGYRRWRTHALSACGFRSSLAAGPWVARVLVLLALCHPRPRQEGYDLC